MAPTIDGEYIHVSDRIQNVMEAFDVSTFERFTYDLTSVNGKNGLKGAAGGCLAKSVKDDENLPLNDPAPDLLERTPDGKYLMIAFRGPAPVSVAHSAQGSCPGVGVVKLSKSGKTGKLVDVLRTTNTVEDNVDAVISGGVNYSASQRSDIHGATVVPK